MKKLLLLIVLVAGTYIQAQTEEKKEAIQFETTEIVRENIPYDSKDLFIFEFKNVSKSPVTVTNVQTSCGCTAAEKPEAPVEPGKKGKISVSYDTKRVGPFTKTITITNDQGDPVVLTIRGSVEAQKIE
jgi:hypothetical protein